LTPFSRIKEIESIQFNEETMRISKTSILLFVAVAIGMGIVYANVRLLVPQESPGSPFYARIERGLIHHTEEWAAIAFYRDPSCVPLDFNLLDLFDAPRAFGCALTVHGFESWKNGPSQGDMAPIQSKLQGDGAVPIWFVRWNELQAAVADDVLTIGELESLPSFLEGYATFFEETLHPMGGAQQTMLEIIAYGLLEDGRSFEYKVTEVKGTLKHVTIEFK